MAIEEANLTAGQRVVYPNQGVCRVVGTTELEIGGQRETFITLAREDDRASLMIPRGRVEKVGLRPVASSEELADVFAYLADMASGPELDWKIRQRTHGEKISEGGLMGLAHVVKGLATLSDVRPLPPKEREVYDNTRHLLVAEIAASSGVNAVIAEDAIDLALFPPGVVRAKPALAVAVAAVDPLEIENDPLLASLGGVDSDLGIETESEASDEESDESEGEPEEEREVEPKPKRAPAAKKATPKKDAAKKTAAPKAAKPSSAKPKAAPLEAPVESEATQKTKTRAKKSKNERRL